AKIEASASLRVEGGKFVIRRLALFRDVFYLPWLEGGSDISPRHREMRTVDLQRREQEFRVPSGMFLLLGDNSPSSTDGRRWGFVPESEIVGRASFIWWPPSRWRVLH
ncbi:MAG: signal peptidase I, partial [Planctomycetota bacterium]|nr:signal peptidase I [Planctomycetota bacterium]